MKYEQIREAVRNHPKYRGCVKIERSPLINPGFPGTFNLSFTEDVWLKEYGRYVDFNHDYIFSTIQSCIRPKDILELDNKNAWKYLGVFEMGDLTGMVDLKERPDYSVLQRKQIKDLVTFLGTFGIQPERIFPTYNVGGSVRDLTEGKYVFDFEIPADDISRRAFLECGIPQENLILDSTRDTFLAVHLHRPTPWGYRNEVNVNIGSKNKPLLLDIATLEYSLWRPKLDGDESLSKNIVGIEESKDGMLVNAFGLERLCMTINGLNRIQDIDYISEFYKKFKELKKNEDILAGESLRALHRIYSDIGSYECNVSKNRKVVIRKFLRNISDLNNSEILELLKVHTETQPWHENLEEGIRLTLDRIELYRKAVG